MATPRTVAIDLYVAGVANELRRDLFKHHALGLEAYSAIVIPRAEKLTSLVQRAPRFLGACAALLDAIWGFVFPILVELQALKMRASSRNTATLATDTVFIVNSRIALSSAKRCGFTGTLLVDAPHFDSRNMRDGQSALLLREVARVSEIREAASRARASLRAVRRAHRHRGAQFQTYNAFYWHLLLLVLERLAPAALWFVSDSDSWAVLFDQADGPSQRFLVQHGLLRDPGGLARDRPGSTLPTRLENITHVMLLEVASEEAFRTIVLADGCDPDFDLLPNAQDRVPQGSGVFRVLIVGQPHTIAEEIDLARRARQQLVDCQVMIKPHPSYSVRPYRARQNEDLFGLLGDSETLHGADAVVTFAASTLMTRYELAGVPVLMCERPAEALTWLVDQSRQRDQPDT